MKTTAYLILSAAGLLLLAGCGTSRQVKEAGDIQIGYGTITEEERTNAMGRLKMEDPSVKAYSNMYDYLAGRVPGVQVFGHKIIVRGISTNSSNTDPLLLVDGVQVPNLDSINPADVERVDVIKDGSTAIYGISGANGVILITTKNH